MRISKKTQYGLRAIIFLAKKKGEIVPLSEISKRERIPFYYLEKIFSLLEKARIVGAKKGVQGGYFLKKDLQKIKAKKILECLEGKTKLVECLFDFCPREKECSAKILWKELDKSINKTLNNINLKDLILKNGKNK